MTIRPGGLVDDVGLAGNAADGRAFRRKILAGTAGMLLLTVGVVYGMHFLRYGHWQIVVGFHTFEDIWDLPLNFISEPWSVLIDALGLFLFCFGQTRSYFLVLLPPQVTRAAAQRAHVVAPFAAAPLAAFGPLCLLGAVSQCLVGTRGVAGTVAEPMRWMVLVLMAGAVAASWRAQVAILRSVIPLGFLRGVGAGICIAGLSLVCGMGLALLPMCLAFGVAVIVYSVG